MSFQHGKMVFSNNPRINSLKLEVFKVRLDGPLSNVFQWKLSLPMAGELNDQMIFKVLSNPNHSVVLFYKVRGLELLR